MMDFHILIVISCVFLASLFSWLFINKFFRRKTFDEIVAEKKALSDKIYAQAKAAAKKTKKVQPSKKDQKREKKQRQREEKHKDIAAEHDESDTQSEKPSVEDEPPRGLSKTHVEFEPDPEILDYATNGNQQRRASKTEKEKEQLNAGPTKNKSKKDKKPGGAASKAAVTGGILVNKNEPVAIKPNVNAEESLNNFEAKPPKDVVELKKAEKERKDEKPQQHQGKKEKNANKKEKATVATTVANAVEQIAEVPHIAKELKQTEEKPRVASPKSQQNGHHNNNNAHQKNKQQQKKQSNKESAATKEIVQALDKLSQSDTVSYPLLMNLFRCAELNRSEIQMLIDYLLNKQQDTPASHSEWSDDICQKLKRQLEEKERALIEEQGASVGMQAKLRELRAEINAERAQMTATVKAYTEKLHSKDQDLTGLNQELQSLNEKLALERQQFQAKLIREKQAGSQDLLAQLQIIQNELAQKDKCIAELTCIVNASRQAVEESQQKNEIIQKQQQQLLTLEHQRDELEQVSNNRIFELEKAKELETENAETKVELLNLQNALESAKADLAQSRKDLELVKSDITLARNVELSEKQQQVQALQAQNAELQQQLAALASKKDEQHSKEQTGLQATLDALRIELAEKEKQLTEFATKNTELLQQYTVNTQQYGQQQQELQQRIDTLNADVANKHKQLQDNERISAEKFTNREKELMQQLQEQKEKNNDLRMKNWKLIEALQSAETTATVKQKNTLSKQNANLVQQQQEFHAANTAAAAAASHLAKDEKHVREIFQRLYPDAVKACAGNALSLPFDQWVEQVLSTHIKQSIANAVASTTSVSSSNKSTQSSSSSNSNHNSSHNNSHSNNNNKDNNNTLNSESSTATKNDNSNHSRTAANKSSETTSSSTADDSSDPAELQELFTQNSQLRAQVDELTKLVTKTSNTLTELEGYAREQDENWRSIVQSKDEQINALQHSNGEQDI